MYGTTNQAGSMEFCWDMIHKSSFTCTGLSKQNVYEECKPVLKFKFPSAYNFSIADSICVNFYSVQKISIFVQSEHCQKKMYAYNQSIHANIGYGTAEPRVGVAEKSKI